MKSSHKKTGLKPVFPNICFCFLQTEDPSQDVSDIEDQGLLADIEIHFLRTGIIAQAMKHHRRSAGPDIVFDRADLIINAIDQGIFAHCHDQILCGWNDLSSAVFKILILAVVVFDLDSRR